MAGNGSLWPQQQWCCFLCGGISLVLHKPKILDQLSRNPLQSQRTAPSFWVVRDSLPPPGFPHSGRQLLGLCPFFVHSGLSAAASFCSIELSGPLHGVRRQLFCFYQSHTDWDLMYIFVAYYSPSSMHLVRLRCGTIGYACSAMFAFGFRLSFL